MQSLFLIPEIQGLKSQENGYLIPDLPLMTNEWWDSVSSSIKCSWPPFLTRQVWNSERRLKESPFKFVNPVCGSLAALSFLLLLLLLQKKKCIRARSHYSPTSPVLTQGSTGLMPGSQLGVGRQIESEYPEACLQSAFADTTGVTHSAISCGILITQVCISLFKYKYQLPSSNTNSSSLPKLPPREILMFS